MGLDITIAKGKVHPNYLQSMSEGEAIGCGLKYDGRDIVQISGGVYDARRMYRVRDALVAVMDNASESEYHLLTPRRVIDLRDTAKRYADMLIGNPGDVYYDELDKLRELQHCMESILSDESEDYYFAIWG
jgi:hypothetical protein